MTAGGAATGGGPPGSRDGEVPRLPRGRLLRLDLASIFRIAMIAVVLLAVVGLRRPCADGMASFVTTFDPPSDAGAASAPAPTLQLERLTEEDIRRRFPGPGPDDAGPAAAPTPTAPTPTAPTAPTAPTPTPAAPTRSP